MYEEIRKPRMLQDVPLSLIRPLPVLYYANKFVTSQISVKVRNLYQSNLTYLGDALLLIGQLINNIEFRDVASYIQDMDQTISTSHIEKIQSLSLDLARLCTLAKQELRNKSHEIKMTAMNLYSKQVDPLKILVISTDQNMDNVQKVMGILKGFCQYSVDCSQYDSPVLNHKLVDSDFIIFSSTSSPEIHQQVKKIDTYRTPGLAIVPINSKSTDIERAVRHGSQLLKTGLPVLFRMFTPLRIFTTIEKTYLAYHLR